MKTEKQWQPMGEYAKAGLCCPNCRNPLAQEGENLRCSNPGCGRIYPIVGGIPVLINEENSLFSISDYCIEDALRARLDKNSKEWMRWLPGISLNLRSNQNFHRFAELLLQKTPQPLVLVVGGRITGKGMEALSAYPSLRLVSSDIAFGPQTQLICDAHDIAFVDGFFDGVIAQAVLEHVLDPTRCVAELHRVLKPDGIVYAETPFMQQVHEGRYDFTRFTDLGHRRLFRWFSEIVSGAAGGPGMALAWSLRYFFLSFATAGWQRELIGALTRLGSFFWKYFDPILIRHPAAYDAAAGYYFLGRKSDAPLSDRELIKLYRGAILK